MQWAWLWLSEKDYHNTVVYNIMLGFVWFFLFFVFNRVKKGEKDIRSRLSSILKETHF